MGLTRAALTAVTLAALFAVGAVHSGCECPKIHQDVFVATPDATLAPLVEACRSGVPTAGQSCSSSTSGLNTDISCPCLPLCRRVMELIDQFSGEETLISCHLLRASVAAGAGDAGAGLGGAGGTTNTRPLSARPDTVQVAVTYRPSTCE